MNWLEDWCKVLDAPAGAITLNLKVADVKKQKADTR
jgi:hypothetical protein